MLGRKGASGVRTKGASGVRHHSIISDRRVLARHQPAFKEDSGDTTPCKVTPVILHGVVSPDILHEVVSPDILHRVVSPTILRGAISSEGLGPQTQQPR